MEPIEFIKYYGLVPATRRDYPVLFFSNVILGYTKYLRQKTGISYKAGGALRYDGETVSLFNEEDVVSQTEEWLSCNKDCLSNIFNSYFDEYKTYLAKFEAISTKDDDPEILVTQILEFYPNYYSCVGLHNSVRRYLGNRESTEIFSKELVRQVGVQRDEIASLYPKIEKFLQIKLGEIGKSLELPEALNYLTIEELNIFLKKKILPNTNDILDRKKNYLALYCEDDGFELVTSDPKILMQARELFPLKSVNSNIIFGYGAFPGKVKGKVFNYLTKKTQISSGDILVTNMTHPSIIHLLKNCSAIVTDEGGVLCHAAIVARELKIPCIIGTKNATRIFHSGDIVQVDANNGVVTKIDDSAGNRKIS